MSDDLPIQVGRSRELTPEQAREAVLAGQRVRMTVGTGFEDPTLIVWRDGGGIMSESIAGWSRGVVEPVCGADSDFLRTYLMGRERLQVVDLDQALPAPTPERER